MIPKPWCLSIKLEANSILGTKGLCGITSFCFFIARGMSLNKKNIFINKGIHHVVRHSPGWTLINDLLVICKWVQSLGCSLVTLGSAAERKILIHMVLQNTNPKTQQQSSPCGHREWAWTTVCIIPVFMQEKPSTNNQKWVLFFTHSDKVVAEGSFERERHLLRGEYFFHFSGKKKLEEILPPET